MGFINEFTGAPIQTSYPSYLELDFTSITSFQLEWAFENQNTLYPFSNVIQAINTATDDTIILPTALVSSLGTTTTIVNTGLETILINDFEGNIVETILTTQQWQFTLTDNTTAAGTWLPLQLASTASAATAYDLIDRTLDTNNHSNAGGLNAYGNFLKQNILVNTNTATNPYLQQSGDRGALLVWTAGTGTYKCLDAATLGNGFSFIIQNNSAGAIITIAPATGDTINSSTDTFTLSTGQSSLFVSNGVNTIFSYGSSSLSNIITSITEVKLDEAVAGVIIIDDVQAATTIQQYVNTNAITLIVVNYPAQVGEYVVENTSATNYLQIQMIGETITTYQFVVQPLKTGFFFSDGVHMYSAPQQLYNAIVSLDQGTAALPSLSFNLDATSGLYQPITGTYTNFVSIAQGGVQSMAFANSSIGPNTSLNDINTVGFSYLDNSISIYTIMRAYG
jgi:hypothetical protein